MIDARMDFVRCFALLWSSLMVYLRSLAHSLHFGLDLSRKPCIEKSSQCIHSGVYITEINFCSYQNICAALIATVRTNTFFF